MSTRGCYTFVDIWDNERTEYHVYKHSDNYPEGEYGGIAAINAALNFAWELPRYEADEFAASFITANKDGQGNVRLLPQGDKAFHGRDVFPGDIEYHYIISCSDGVLMIECRRPGDASNGYFGELIKGGTLKEMMKWAEVPAPKKAKKVS